MTSDRDQPMFNRNRVPCRTVEGVKISRSTSSAARIALVYAVAAGLWIFVSDHLLFQGPLSPAALETMAVYKGWLFVAATAGLLFWSVRRNLHERREHDDRLQLFVEHAPVALAMLDRDLRYVVVSRRWKQDYQMGDQDLRGASYCELFPDLPQRWHEAHTRGLAGETIREEVDKLEVPGQPIAWKRWEVRPWLDHTGAIGGIVIFTEDITVRKQAEFALAESQARLRLAIECGQVGTWSWDLVSGAVDCDEAIARLLGRSRQELTRGGRDFFMSCLHPADGFGLERAVGAALRDGRDFTAEYRIVRPDGSILWISDRASVDCDAGGRPIRMFGAFVDVTPLKRVEQALQDSENRLREVVETIDEVFWITDVSKATILYVSPGYEKVWGRPCADLYTSPDAWLEAIHVEDRERVKQAAMTQQAEGTYDETYRIVRPDATIRWVRDHAYPVRDDSGEVVRIVGAAEDVTERKKLEQQFLHAQRLEAIGTLATGVAHDLNNILAPMFMIGSLLKPKLVDPADVAMLNVVETSAQRGANVVRQLLTFGRGIAGDRGPLQLRHLVKEMTAMMGETFPREIGITQNVPSNLWPVVGDATQIHQVLMNLCVNARDAMAGGGSLGLEARNVVLAEADLRQHPGMKPGRYVVLTVSDTGHGVPAEIQAQIFEPFFTTKEIGKGTGLGLSTVLGIVKSHGGFVTLDSSMGRGTSFHVHLPSAEMKEMAVAANLKVPAAVGRGELILVVDDEAGVRIAMQHVLEKNGYRVLTATNGREGLRIFLLHENQIRAVVTDLMMPEMDGIALVRALRDLKPALAVLAATGLDGTEKRDTLMDLGVTELLPKPYAPAELLEALDREIKKSPTAGQGVP